MDNEQEKVQAAAERIKKLTVWADLVLEITSLCSATACMILQRFDAAAFFMLGALYWGRGTMIRTYVRHQKEMNNGKGN